jgi:hypothetical protein
MRPMKAIGAPMRGEGVSGRGRGQDGDVEDISPWVENVLVELDFIGCGAMQNFLSNVGGQERK